MKKFITCITALLLMAATAIMFVGCGEPLTLEEYVNDNADVQEQLDDTAKNLGDGGKVTVKENNVEIAYQYDETMKGDTLTEFTSQIKEAMDSLESKFQDVEDQLKENSGIDDATMTYVYLNGDGSEIYSVTYK